MHVAFNQGGEAVSFYDYTGVAPKHPGKPRPTESFYFPQLITYELEKEHMLALLRVKGETEIRVIKEVDPGVWLVYLGQQETFALYNIASDGHVKCKLHGLPGYK